MHLNSWIDTGAAARCTYEHLSLFSLIKRWDLNWGTLTCELFTDSADLSSSFKRASSKNNHNWNWRSLRNIWLSMSENTFFLQNFGLDYEDTLYQIIDCSNALIIVKNYYLINKTYLSLAGNVWNIEKCENLLNLFLLSSNSNCLFWLWKKWSKNHRCLF